MDQALHVIKLSKFDGSDFEVQTSLFSSYISTRIFTPDDRIPVEIVEKVRKLSTSSDVIDKVFVNTDNVWDDDHSVYSTTEFSGVAVETYSFQDAGYIHGSVYDVVEEFLASHKRVVTYVPKTS